MQVIGGSNARYEWLIEIGNSLVSIDIDNNRYSNRYHGVHQNILWVFDDLILEASYVCKIRHLGKTLRSEPICLTVHTPIDEYKRVLIDRYIQQPEVLEDTWPPVSVGTYIDLALIKQESIHKAGEYGRCTIQGDIDDIFNDKESIRIAYEKVFGNLNSGERLLIEGRPGSGKTTLVHRVSQDWGNRKIKLRHTRLLLLVHLRGFCSDSNIGLRNILDCYFSHDKKAIDSILKYANKHYGLGLCFILDGLDEYLPPNKKDNFIYKLIKKQVFSKSIVIVASRPSAAADFRSVATRQVEVLGFLRDQTYAYIRKYHQGLSKQQGLSKYLDEHPNVLHMCYLPIHCSMVCFLYGVISKVEDFPQTETEIYKDFTKFTILRTLYRSDNESEVCMTEIEDLPVSKKDHYKKICELAFEMTSSSKQVMKQSNLSTKLEDNELFGLITVDKMAMQCGFQNLYTFLHLTFQEFLAAYYISMLHDKDQKELIEKYRNSIKMKQVWKFYCGLVQFDNHHKFKALVEQSQHDTLFKIQCSFESKQPSTCDSVVKIGSLHFVNNFLTTSDFTAIAYVISNTQQQHVIKVLLDKCPIGQEGVDILVKKASGRLSFITTLCYHGYDCVAEQLSVVNKLMHSLPSLEILDISNTKLAIKGIAYLTSDLNHSNLQILRVGSRKNACLSSELARSFFSNCRKFVNICFSTSNIAYSSEELLPLPFYFYCNWPEIDMCFCKLRPIEIKVISDDLLSYHWKKSGIS